MEKDICQINQELNSFLINTYRRKKFNRDHIFYEVLEILKNEFKDSTRLKIIFIFSEIEKCVSLLKNKSEFSNVQIIKADKLYNDLNESLKKYMGISYHPMKALEYYNLKNFTEAIKQIDLFFKKSNEVLLKNKNVFIYANAEQYLNLFSIYVENNNEKEVIQRGFELMQFCYYNVLPLNNRIKFVSFDYESVDIEEVKYWRIYITNSIFRKLIVTNKKNIIKEIINKISKTFHSNNNIDNYFKNAIQCMYYFYRKEYDKSILYFRESIKFYDQYCEILLYLNLNNIKKLIFNSKNSEKNEEELRTFSKLYNDLIETRLKHFFTAEQIISL